MNFFEAIWHGEGIGDGADLEEALQAYSFVRPDDGDWEAVCSIEGANPHLMKYSSFDDYLDNADALEEIPISSPMLAEAIDQ